VQAFLRGVRVVPHRSPGPGAPVWRRAGSMPGSLSGSPASRPGCWASPP
jgi:hypothetical protein